MVVWRTDLYKQEAFRQLADTKFYTKVNKDLTQANQKIVKDTVNKLILEQKLPSTARNLFVTTPKTSTFYLKPKIHKPNNPGRPIISACSCPTELISSFLDKKMAPFVKSLPTYIKDTNHALNILKQISIFQLILPMSFNCKIFVKEQLNLSKIIILPSCAEERRTAKQGNDFNFCGILKRALIHGWALIRINKVYRKIQIISPGAYFWSKGLFEKKFLGGPILGGAYTWTNICVLKIFFLFKQL